MQRTKKKSLPSASTLEDDLTADLAVLVKHGGITWKSRAYATSSTDRGRPTKPEGSKRGDNCGRATVRRPTFRQEEWKWPKQLPKKSRNWSTTMLQWSHYTIWLPIAAEYESRIYDCTQTDNNKRYTPVDQRVRDTQDSLYQSFRQYTKRGT